MSFSKKQLFIIGFIFIAILLRILPHPPNVTAVTAAALFGGAYFNNKAFAYIIPLLVMVLSDIILGFSSITIFVYIAFILVSTIGILFKKVTIF